MIKTFAVVFALPILLVLLQGCAGSTSGQSSQAGTTPSPPRSQEAPSPESSSLPDSPPEVRRDACGHATGQGESICLGVKYVAYEDSQGVPALTSEAAVGNIGAVNRIWARCDISFHLSEYQSVQPGTLGLNANPANSSEMVDIRKEFEDPNHLLIVTTENWDRSGTLGSTGANAWTSMPGSFPYGVVLESSVGTFANIIAHELGHYLGLDHSSDATSLMSPLIYSDSVNLTDQDCATARQTTQSYWSSMLD